MTRETKKKNNCCCYYVYVTKLEPWSHEQEPFSTSYNLNLINDSECFSFVYYGHLLILFVGAV